MIRKLLPEFEESIFRVAYNELYFTFDIVCAFVDPIWLCVWREWDRLSGGLGRSNVDGCLGIIAVAYGPS